MNCSLHTHPPKEFQGEDSRLDPPQKTALPYTSESRRYLRNDERSNALYMIGTISRSRRKKRKDGSMEAFPLGQKAWEAPRYLTSLLMKRIIRALQCVR